MDDKETISKVYAYALKVIAENDILRKQVEMVKFVLNYEYITNGAQWAGDLLLSIDQVGKKPDD